MISRPNFGMGMPASNFDATWYAQNNPDVASAGVDPLTHYQIFGQKEGRAANAADVAKGLWTQVMKNGAATQEMQSAPSTPSAPSPPVQSLADKSAQTFAANPYGFDAQYYLQQYPDIAASGVDPEQHYLQFGMNEGRARNGIAAQGGVPATNVAAGIMAPPPPTAPPLDPNDPASWANWRGKAQAATQGLNRMPNVAPGTETLSADPLAVAAQFYPKGNPIYQPSFSGAASERAQAYLSNLGMRI